MSLALEMRMLLWRDSADRLLLEEEARVTGNTAGQIGPGKVAEPVIGRDGAGAKASVGD